MFEAADSACRGQVFWDRFKSLLLLPFDPQSSELAADMAGSEGTLTFCSRDDDDEKEFVVRLENNHRECVLFAALDPALRFKHGLAFGSPVTDVGAAEALALTCGPFTGLTWNVFAPADEILFDDEESNHVDGE